MDANYKIIGGDGVEYGPVSLEELKSWIVDGRVAAITQVWSSAVERWLPAGQYTELHPEIGQVAALASAAQSMGQEFARVGFWPRFSAYIIDSIVLYAAFSLLSMLLAKSLGWQEIDFSTVKKLSDLEPYFDMLMQQTLAYYLLQMVYEVAMNGRLGATVGKLVMGMQIVRMDGSPLGYSVALFRFFGRLVSNFTCYIGYLMVAFREDKRALHDLLAGTQVVYRR